MPRQPLPGKCRNPADWSINPGDIAKRPQHAVLIADCNALWSSTDVQLGILLSTLMKADSDVATEAAISVYATLRRSTPRYEALTAAGKVTLDTRDFEILGAVLEVCRSAEAQRNDLAHGIFGVHVNMPDSILWIPSNEVTLFALSMLRQETATGARPLVDAHKPLEEFIRHYTVKDLEDVRQQVEFAYKAVFRFTSYLRTSADPKYAFLRDQLCDPVLSLAPIQEALRLQRERARRNRFAIPLQRYVKRRRRG